MFLTALPGACIGAEAMDSSKHSTPLFFDAVNPVAQPHPGLCHLSFAGVRLYRSTRQCWRPGGIVGDDDRSLDDAMRRPRPTLLFIRLFT